MQHTSLDLRRAAVAVGAEPFSFVSGLDKRRTAYRTSARELRLGTVHWAFFQFYSGDFRDDFATLFNIYPIPDAYVHLLHQAGVVEGCALDDSAAELHWGEVRDRGHRSRPAHLVVYAQHWSACLLRLELECHCPTGGFGSVSE